MGASHFPTADILNELSALADRNIYARACLREFLNTKPVIAALKVDCGSASGTGHRVMDEEPSEELVRCLSACRAIAADTERNSLGGSEAHDEITPEMFRAGIEAYAAMFSEVHFAGSDPDVERKLVERIFRTMWREMLRPSGSHPDECELTPKPLPGDSQHKL